MTSTPSTSPFHAWLLAARPKTLPAAIGPILVGAALAYADGVFAWLPVLAALICALLLQIGSNFANDYFDHQRGADSDDRLGPVRVTSAGLLTPSAMRRGMVTVFSLAALLGLYLIWVGGWPILVAGVAAIVAALAYTGGPYPFGYYGLGEPFVFIFFGLVAVGGTYYLQAQQLPLAVLVAAIPSGALITAILVVNNLRDLETDRRAGKRTLAVMIGRRNTQREYLLLLLVAYLTIPGLILGGAASPWVFLSWLTLPLAWRLGHAVSSGVAGRALNPILASTAQLSFLFALLFAVGLIV